MKPPHPQYLSGSARFRPARLLGAACSALLSLLLPSLGAPSPVADAAQQADHAAVRDALRRQADVDAPQPDGMTALHWAAYLDDLGIAQTLLTAHASVEVTNHFSVTPLSLACQNGNTTLVQRLLELGASPNTTLPGGETALMTAARNGKPGPVSALLQHGAEVHARESRGQTALMWAAAEGHAAVVELLIQAGANLHDALPDSGFSPLLFAAREGRTEVVRTLIKAGVDIHAATQPRKPSGKGPFKGTTALVLAVENGHFELALALLEAGADPNDQRSGFTPLHILSWVRKPNRGEDDGAPPPQGSGSLDSLTFARKLVEHGADVNRRLEAGSGAPARYTRRGSTPFLMAAATADIAFMRWLHQHGADPSLANADRCTPLIAACGNVVGSDAANEKAGEEPEVLEAAQWLLDHGADVNAVDANGETAMHAAAYKNLPKVIRFLADHGAKPEVWNRKNRYGWTPVEIAEGHRPGNFKPSAETRQALLQVLSPSTSEPVSSPQASR